MLITFHGFNLCVLKNPSISLFSEGNIYFSTFKPLVDSFISKQIYITYYTLDSKDEILKIQNEYLDTKYLGSKYLSYFKFSLISSDYLISTTPNIGSTGYPYKKPRLVKNLVHVFHSISDISIYRKGSLDSYDSVILAGEFQKESIRKLESLRGLKEKELLPLGVPYFDFLIKKEKKIKNLNKTILIGSSWGDKGCLKSYGIEFINQLATKGYNIIVRPHPHSIIYEKKFINMCRDELEKIENITWDDSISPSKSMNISDILISDTSSLRFDFFMIYKKPVITLEIKNEEMLGYEREFLGINWTDYSSYEIGPVISKDSISELGNQISHLINNFNIEKVPNYRNKTIYNYGMASDCITDYFMKNIKFR